MANLKVTLLEQSQSEEDLPVPHTSAPDTGLFTISDQTSSGNSISKESITIGFGVFILSFAILCLLTIIYKRYFSHGFHIRSARKAVFYILGFSIIIGAITTINVDKKEDAPVLADTSSSLTLSVSEHSLSVTPSKNGKFGYTYHDVKVNEATTAGYTLSAYASSANLVNSSDAQSVISSINSTTKTALTTNTWGVSSILPEDVTSSIWTSMPTSANSGLTIKDSTSATSAKDSTRVYYGVYVNTELAYGDYTNTINYVAVAHQATSGNTDPTPTPTPNTKTISDLTYMQEFKTLSSTDKTSVLDSMTENQQYTLKDNRDDKTYFIAKLADGNVWMTQNLNLELNSNTTYTPDNTDIPSNWKPTRSTYDDTGSWHTYNTFDQTPESIDLDIDLMYWSGEFNINDNLSNNEMMVGYNSANPHYSIGNYYNWPAAIAVNDASAYTGEQKIGRSICPAGWRLPTKQEFDTMTDDVKNQNDNVHFKDAPLYLAYVGYYGGAIAWNEFGRQANYWIDMSSHLGDDYASGISVGDSDGTNFDTISATDAPRNFGYSIRCVSN